MRHQRLVTDLVLVVLIILLAIDIYRTGFVLVPGMHTKVYAPYTIAKFILLLSLTGVFCLEALIFNRLHFN